MAAGCLTTFLPCIMQNARVDRSKEPGHVLSLDNSVALFIYYIFTPPFRSHSGCLKVAHNI